MRGKVLSLTPEQVVERAIAACAVPATGRIWYSVGAGGKDPEAPNCATKGTDGRLVSDCVGFALWAYGMDRYQPPAWWNQNSIYAAAHETHHFWRFCDPYPGCLALIRGPIPGDRRVGHIGVMVGPDRVVHCSPANHRRVGQGIAETSLRQAFGTSRPVYYVERTT